MVISELTGSEARQENSLLLWLLGQPHLEDYLTFVKNRVVGGDAIEPRSLASEWRAANDHYYDLEIAEAGDADRIDTRDLDPKVADLAEAIQANRHFRNTFDTFPITIEMVELDRLIVWQSQIANQFSTANVKLLGQDPSPEELFRFCLPLDRPLPPVRVTRLSANHYQFDSDSTDLSAFGPSFLTSETVQPIAELGPTIGGLGVAIGFGANMLSAIRSDERIVLHNGYHRAYALRSIGITHAPCVVQTVTRRDELRVAADWRVAGDPGYYFKAARPPMLRDFFNPKLVKELIVRPMRSFIDVQLVVTSWSATDIVPE